MKQFLTGLFIWVNLLVYGQEANLIAEWTFHPNYQLPGNAANLPGNVIMAPQSRFERFKIAGPPIEFWNEKPTQRIKDIPLRGDLPLKDFSIELWVLNHVNMPVGALVAARNSDEIVWVIGNYDEKISLDLAEGRLQFDTIFTDNWKKYWTHLVTTCDDESITLYLNGKLVKEMAPIPLKSYEDLHLEISGYFRNEPYMEISNFLKRCRIYDQVLSKQTIQKRFELMKDEVDRGLLFDSIFHFNAGPYLNYSTKSSVNVLWETDRMSRASIDYGPTIPMGGKKIIGEPGYIQECTLDSLEENTLYYYQITATSESGDSIQSGILTFKTAVRDEDPFTFCVIGDTESRPHVNHRLSQLIWGERPDFLMHLGDVTDGGFQQHKFEWNLEYFTGITALASRIPVFPVAGNGEGDLYWYNRYHRLPDPESYYSFRFGNAEFFMLNSNVRDELKSGGVQYELLKSQLLKSTAMWKFVAHHHCPVSSDENDFGNTWEGEPSSGGDPRFDDLKKLYQDEGVDVVFYGHVHAYERSYPLTDGSVDEENGVVYIKSGGAGGHLEDYTAGRYNFSNTVQHGNHYCRVNISGNKLDFKVFDLEGRLKDFFQITK
ncbi:MAG: metallophosphoesterase [Saprospiraceae bacterium]|nr:metallophosphoesterase [Saprospiraceae bacterium]